MKYQSLSFNEIGSVQGKTVHCHPNVYDRLRKELDKIGIAGQIDTRNPLGFTSLYGFQIKTNPSLSETRWNGQWVRTNILPDTRFFTWIENIDNPSEWQIQAGMVKKELEDVFYIEDPSSYRLFTDMRYNFKLTPPNYTIKTCS